MARPIDGPRPYFHHLLGLLPSADTAQASARAPANTWQVIGDYCELSIPFRGPEYVVRGTRWTHDTAAPGRSFGVSDAAMGSRIRLLDKLLFAGVPDHLKAMDFNIVLTPRSSLDLLGHPNVHAYYDAQRGQLVLPRSASQGSLTRFGGPVSIARHEFAHAVDRGGRNDGMTFEQKRLASRSNRSAFVEAQQADTEVAARVLALASSAHVAGRRAVNAYGAASVAEDWAESFRMYVEDELGNAAYRIRGLRFRFAELFPARARYFLELFGT